MPKVTPNSANKLFTQFKDPSTSSECKVLDFTNKLLTFDRKFGILGGCVGPPGLGAYFAPTLAAKRCFSEFAPYRSLLQYTSIINVI